MKYNERDYTVHINGKISTRQGESDLENVIFSCLKDDEILFANKWMKQKLKEKNENVKHEYCCECGNTKQLICISFPYVDMPKFRCQNFQSKLYDEFNR